MPDIAENIALVKARIKTAASAAKRDTNDILLLAVSKTQSVAAISDALLAGQIHFGENYLQDALPKIKALQDKSLIWHFIGRLQSNKTRDIAENFSWVHSVSSLKHARRLNAQRPTSLQPLNVCLQVNISADPAKDGFEATEILPTVNYFHEFPQLALRGLMTIPARAQDSRKTQQDFHALRKLRDQTASDRYPLKTLSMGMSGDLNAAIIEGATIVRIGTAIFGARVPK